MAKPPIYKQDTLASQNVGTPGLDQSANVLSEASAQAGNRLAASQAENNTGLAQGLANVLGGVVHATAYELRSAQNDYETMQRAQQQKILDRRLSDALFGHYNVIKNTKIQAENDSVNNPMAAQYAFRNKAINEMNETIKIMRQNKEDERVIDAFKTKVQDRITSETNTLAEWGRATEKQNSVTNFNNMLVDTSKAMGQARNIDEMFNALTDLGSVLPGYEGVLGSAQTRIAVMREGRNGAIQFLKNQANTNPEEIEKILKDERLSAFGLKETDKIAVMKAAENEIDARKTEADNKIKAANGLKLADLAQYQSALSGNEDIATAQGVIKSVTPLRDEILKMTPEQRAPLMPVLKAYNATIAKASGQITTAKKKRELEAARLRAMNRQAEAAENRNRIEAERDKKAKLKEIRESPAAVAYKDDIGAMVELLASEKEAAKSKNPADEIAFATELVTRVNKARELGYATDEETRHAMNLARARLVQLQAKVANKPAPAESSDVRVSKKIISEKPSIDITTPLLIQAKKSGFSEVDATKRIDQKYKEARSKAEQVFRKQNSNRAPESAADWDLINRNVKSYMINRGFDKL